MTIRSTKTSFPYVYEGREPRVVPSQCVTTGWPPFWHEEPAAQISWRRILHGEQSFVLHRPLPLQGTIKGDHSVLAVEDPHFGVACTATSVLVRGEPFAIVSENKAMNVLLLSMPDSFEHMPTVAVRMPNGALTSLAGNIDPHHKVAVADLILVQNRVRETVERLVLNTTRGCGLSVMTFQRKTAMQIVELVRSLKPDVRVIVGGYDPSLASEAYMEMEGVDFIVRGEGEVTFRELLRAIGRRRRLRQDSRAYLSRKTTAGMKTPRVRCTG